MTRMNLDNNVEIIIVGLVVILLASATIDQLANLIRYAIKRRRQK